MSTLLDRDNLQSINEPIQWLLITAHSKNGDGGLSLYQCKSYTDAKKTATELKPDDYVIVATLPFKESRGVTHFFMEDVANVRNRVGYATHDEVNIIVGKSSD